MNLPADEDSCSTNNILREEKARTKLSYPTEANKSLGRKPFLRACRINQGACTALKASWILHDSSQLLWRTVMVDNDFHHKEL